MSNISYFLNLGHFEHIIKQSGLIKFCELLKTEIPVLIVHLGIQMLVLLTVAITTIIIEPDVIASIRQYES